MKKLIALLALGGLIAAGCASKENRGGSYDNQSNPNFGNGSSSMSTTPNNNTGTSNNENLNKNTDTNKDSNTTSGNTSGTGSAVSPGDATPPNSNNSSSQSGTPQQ